MQICAEDLHVCLNGFSAWLPCSSVYNILVRFNTNDQEKKIITKYLTEKNSDIQ